MALLLLLLPISALAQSAPEAPTVNRDSLQALSEARAVDRPSLEARARALGLPTSGVLEDGTTFSLHSFDGDRPIYLSTDNLRAADSVSTDEVWAGGSLGLALDGAGELLGIWDGGSVRLTHQEFGGRVTNHDGAGNSNHGTHVAGTMTAAGTLATARGMASAAAMRSFDFNNDTAEIAADQLIAAPVKVSNHSYGFITGWRFNFRGDGLWVWFGDVDISTQEDLGFGFYQQTAADWDQIAFDSPYYLMVKSAGNDRNDGPGGTVNHWVFDGMGGFTMSSDPRPNDGGATGYDTIGGGSGSSKNILTVGAVNDVVGGWTQISDVVMSSFSGWGPTDDGRVKPDLVANGVGLISSGSNNDAAYSQLTGTSMSTPNTSGSLGLLHQHANNLYGGYFLAATMKALVLHTADEAGNVGPDYSFGWGLLNTASAADVMTADAATSGTQFHIAEESLADGNTFTALIGSDGSGPLVATIAWTDPAGTPPEAALDPPDLMLVNDLDLRILGPGSTEFQPWILDPANPADAATTGDNFRDNVEQVVIAAPAAGEYTVQVTHKGVLVSPQNFSLIVTGNNISFVFRDDFESGGLSAWSSSTN
ncbi:MAG: S8 family serine peptidase [Acidobacteriota bacterium]